MNMEEQEATIQPFVKNTVPEIIRRDSNAAWDSAVEKFNSPKPSPRVVERTNVFKIFVNRLTRESKKPELNTFRLGQRFKISDVQREANAALQAYEERGSSLKSHFFRTLGRGVSNNASAMEALLAFMPDGEYTFILCGALTLVFNAAKKVKQVREKILDCLGSLTRTVDQTKEFEKLYSGNKELWEAAESLYIGLLDAVQDILAWLDEGAWSRTFKALFKQDNYSAPLEDKIKIAVETRVKEFYDRLVYCQHERIQQIHIGVDKNVRTIDHLQQDVQKGQTIQQVHHENLMQFLVAMCQGLMHEFDWQRASYQALQEGFHQLAQRNYDTTILINLNASTISSSDLLGLLQVSSSTVEDDTRIAMQYGQSLSLKRQDRAAALLKHAKFQSWLKTGRCEILVVNGQDTQSDLATMSSMTYVVGMLARTLISTQVVPLLCICGRHASPGKPLEGAAGVLRLLIHQLLMYVRESADLSLIDQNFIEAVKAGDIRYLREIFRSLIVSVVVKSNGPCAIMCLVDGVSFLETTARRPGLEMLIAFLKQLVIDINGLGGFLIFKVLLTYPRMSHYAQKWFPSEAILTMSEEIDGDRQGYNSVRLSAASEKLVLDAPLS